jgi:hypothetical protein
MMSSQLDLLCFLCAEIFAGGRGGRRPTREQGGRASSERVCVQHSRVPLATYVRHYLIKGRGVDKIHMYWNASHTL